MCSSAPRSERARPLVWARLEKIPMRQSCRILSHDASNATPTGARPRQEHAPVSPLDGRNTFLQDSVDLGTVIVPGVVRWDAGVSTVALHPETRNYTTRRNYAARSDSRPCLAPVRTTPYLFGELLLTFVCYRDDCARGTPMAQAPGRPGPSVFGSSRPQRLRPYGSEETSRASPVEAR